MALAESLPANASSQKVALPNGEVLYYGGKRGAHPEFHSLEAIAERIHNGQSAEHNALWLVLTNRSSSFFYDDTLKIYNFVLTPEGRSEIIRSINGNNMLHQKVADALSNFNTWATRNRFPTIELR